MCTWPLATLGSQIWPFLMPFRSTHTSHFSVDVPFTPAVILLNYVISFSWFPAGNHMTTETTKRHREGIYKKAHKLHCITSLTTLKNSTRVIKSKYSLKKIEVTMNRLIVLALFVVISAVCAEQTSHGVCFYCFHSTTHIQIERLQLVSCVGKKANKL